MANRFRSERLAPGEVTICQSATASKETVSDRRERVAELMMQMKSKRSDQNVLRKRKLSGKAQPEGPALTSEKVPKHSASTADAVTGTYTMKSAKKYVLKPCERTESKRKAREKIRPGGWWCWLGVEGATECAARLLGKRKRFRRGCRKRM